ncbi:hypothetical protein M407DRAFT_86724, partial [Tulasnella calospora MUT 4182]
MIHDAYRVLLQFQSPLRLCAGHVYTTILSFSPVCGLTEHYASQLHVPYVVRGQPARWDAKLITTDTQRTVLALKFFPEGKRIAMGDDRGRISVWSSVTGAEITSTDAPETHVSTCSLDISTDGTRIASSIRFEDAVQLDIWDAITGSRIFRLGDLGTFQRDTFIAFLPNESKRMAITTTELPMQIWDIESGTLLAHFGGDASGVIHAAFSPTEMVVASVDNSGVLRTWDIGPIHSGSNSNASETDSHPCRSVSASRSGRNVVSACSGTRVVLWNIA